MWLDVMVGLWNVAGCNGGVVGCNGGVVAILKLNDCNVIQPGNNLHPKPFTKLTV